MFEPIERSERLSDKVAQQLFDSIISQRLKPGTRLPSERVLGEQFNVSRTVIREAVRHLAAKGVVDVRSGSGARVANVEASSVSESMRLYLRGQSLSYTDVNEVRFALELVTARLAAEHADADDEADLLASCERLSGLMDAPENASYEDVEYHRIVARATHNPLFLVMLDAIGEVLLDIRRATLGIPGRVELAAHHHQLVTAAIMSHDADAAEAAMREHLAESKAAFQQLERTNG